MSALDLRAISFAYTAGVQILDAVDLQVPEGRIVGLLGPNGSGKTTLLQIALDLLALQDGGVSIAGHDHGSVAAKRASMYLPSEDQLPAFLTGREWLRTIARLYDVELSGAEELFTRLGMRGRLDDLIEDYSHGMRKKTQLVAAAIVRRPLTVVDETLNGIDVDALRWCEHELAALRDEGRAVLLCTHDFGLLERLADEVVFLDLGQVVERGPTRQLVSDHGSLARMVFDRLDAGGL